MATGFAEFTYFFDFDLRVLNRIHLDVEYISRTIIDSCTDSILG